MDLSDEEVLLESCCFLLTYHQEQIKGKKRKWKWVREIFKKRIEQGVYHNLLYTAQKMKFSIQDFFSKCDKTRSFLRIWSHLLKKSSIENFNFCAVAGDACQ